MALAPFSRASKLLDPIARLIERPTALHNEKRPPTQSHIGKIFSGSIPNSSAAATLLETATKCLATAPWGALPKNQLRMVMALERVSCVVKDFDTTTKRVVSGLSFLRVSCT